MGCECKREPTASEYLAKVIELLESDEKSGYPPNCNDGYEVSEDGKSCVRKSDDGGGDSSYGSEIACEPGFEEKGGECVRISVTCDVSIDAVVARVEASTGKSIIEITGTAFHEGYNSNNWKITRQGAESTVAQMVGADLTLNHPHVGEGGFSRNMDGGVEEAIVGFITDAFVAYGEDPDKWDVKFKATVAREELFSALESGLWLRDDYGVSIGGTGIPDETIEAEDGSIFFTFASDFTFDHLAIVHNPAYERAKIESVELIESYPTDDFKYQPQPAQNNNEESSMTETEENAIEIASNDVEIESLKADKILLEAQVAEFRAQEEAIREDARQNLVDTATELGMKGHDDLSQETLEGLISSWEDAHPETEEIVMLPVEAKIEDLGNPETPAQDQAIVANWLNKSKVETPEHIYAKAYNIWVSSWNGSLGGSEDRFRAMTYEELRGE